MLLYLWKGEKVSEKGRDSLHLTANSCNVIAFGSRGRFFANTKIIIIVQFSGHTNPALGRPQSLE